jgi:dGTP triphosphohydrolase
VQAAPVRRLQQKTQVFPLDVKASVRSRLTHSLEVQETGRQISRRILAALPAGVVCEGPSSIWWRCPACCTMSATRRLAISASR